MPVLTTRTQADTTSERQGTQPGSEGHAGMMTGATHGWTAPCLQGRLISGAYAIFWPPMEIAHHLHFMKPGTARIVNQMFGEF